MSFERTANKDQANGYAGLTAGGVLAASVMSNINFSDLGTKTHTHQDAANGGQLASAALSNPQEYDPGRRAVNVLRVANNIADGETVVIGADTYEYEVVNTNSTNNTAGGNFNNTTNPLNVATYSVTYPNCPTTLGSLIRIESEILRLTAYAGDIATFARAQSGTTAAAHANAAAIFKGNGFTASRIAVGNDGTLTPAANTDALIGDINGRGTEAVTAVDISNNEILIHSNAAGAVVLACSETLGGANNVWANATMYGGRAAGVRKHALQSRVPKQTEIDLGNMHFMFDFAPVFASVRVYTTATPGVVILWNGAVTVTGNRVTVDNSGLLDWDTTMTIEVEVTD